MSLSQFLEVVEAVLAQLEVVLAPWPGVHGSGLGLVPSRKHGGFHRLGPAGRLVSGGSLILREVVGTLRPASAHLRPNRSLLVSSVAALVSARPRFGGGGGSSGPGPLELKE